LRGLDMTCNPTERHPASQVAAGTVEARLHARGRRIELDVHVGLELLTSVGWKRSLDKNATCTFE
jgi:hypothetical protein